MLSAYHMLDTILAAGATTVNKNGQRLQPWWITHTGRIIPQLHPIYYRPTYYSIDYTIV